MESGIIHLPHVLQFFFPVWIQGDCERATEIVGEKDFFLQGNQWKYLKTWWLKMETIKQTMNKCNTTIQRSDVVKNLDTSKIIYLCLSACDDYRKSSF